MRVPVVSLHGAAAVLAVTCLAGGATLAARSIEPGFNLFSVEQDVEIGERSAAAAERQLPLLRHAAVDAYLERVVAVLAAQAPGARYPYRIETVNDAAINAFALPGGPMYVNRGLLEAVRSEGELAGVLSHEMAHVALRHGTHQASKAYVAQAGVGLLGELLGRRRGDSARVLDAVGGLGLNALFLKFGRDDEYEADEVGARIMAGAGYDPRAMADFFELLRAERGRDPGKLEQFFSSHPPPANREARLRRLAQTLPRGAPRPRGNLARMQAQLRALPAASTARRAS